MRRVLHDGHTPRPLQEKAIRKSCPHCSQRARGVPARVAAGPANGRAAPADRGDARRRRVRDLDSAGAVWLPAPTLRARLPGGLVLPAREAAQQGTDPRRQRGRAIEEGALHEGMGRGLPATRRISSELRADGRGRAGAGRALRNGGRREGRRAERHSPARWGADRATQVSTPRTANGAKWTS